MVRKSARQLNLVILDSDLDKFITVPRCKAKALLLDREIQKVLLCDRKADCDQSVSSSFMNDRAANTHD
jgi:hypothetical protein